MESYELSPLHQKIKKKIRFLTENAWNRKIDWTDVTNWLDNFESSEDINQCEKIQMLHLLSQFMYFGEREIKQLLKCIYRDKYRYNVIRNIRKKNKDTTERNLINRLFTREKLNTRFLGVGNPSESGTHLLYYFRQENSLSKKHFTSVDQIFSKEESITSDREGKTYINQIVSLRETAVTNYVFLDDMCGSGSQACDYLNKIVEDIKELNPKVTISYYVLFANRAGIDRVKNNTKFDNVDCIFELDDSFKCFSENSRHFKSIDPPINKSFSSEIATKYGTMIYPEFPLGFADNQLLIGFNHNTPDNTLPIMWFEENGMDWNSIFKRYNKIYGWSA